MPRTLIVCLVAFLFLVPEADAARRSLRLDSGTVWGPKRECDAAQIDGSTLLWRGHRFEGFAPLAVQNTFCQHAPSLSVSSIPGAPGDEYAAIRALLRAGETISGNRWAFLDIPVDPCCSAPGDSAFQWLFFHFDDVIIVGLFGPEEVGADGIKRAVPVDASTTFLEGPDGTVLWDGDGFDGEWLCFGNDGVFLGAYADADLAQCRQGPGSAPTTPMVLVVPDVDADGLADLALLEASVATVQSGANGAVLATFPLPGQSSRRVAAVALPDSDGDGVPEIGILRSRLADQRGVLQIVELDGSGSREVPVPSSLVVRDMTSLGDANADGIVDVGILARKRDTGRNMLVTRNLRPDPSCVPGSCTLTTIWTRQALGSEGLRVMPMPDANGATTPSTYAVLSRRLADGRALVQLTPGGASVVSRSLVFEAGRTPVDLGVLPDTDADGNPEVAVLLYSNIHPRTLVSARNLDGDGRRYRRFPAGRTPLRLQALPDVDSDGSSESAVLGIVDGTGKGVVQARETRGSPVLLSSVTTGTTTHVTDLVVFPDLDADGIPEAGVIGQDRISGRPVILRSNFSASPGTFIYPTVP